MRQSAQTALPQVSERFFAAADRLRGFTSALLASSNLFRVRSRIRSPAHLAIGNSVVGFLIPTDRFNRAVCSLIRFDRGPGVRRTSIG